MNSHAERIELHAPENRISSQTKSSSGSDFQAAQERRVGSQTRYCQLIRDANKVKRLEYAQQVLETGDTFDNVIFNDECSISLEEFRRTCYRKQSGIGVDFVFFM